MTMARSMRPTTSSGETYDGADDVLPNDVTPGAAGGSDYTVWKINFCAVSSATGAGSGSASTNTDVPEPFTCPLAALALGVLPHRSAKVKFTNLASVDDLP